MCNIIVVTSDLTVLLKRKHQVKEKRKRKETLSAD